MVVGPGVVADAAVDGVVRVAGSLGAEFPDGPAVAVLGVEEGDEPVERVAVRALRVGLRGARAVDMGDELTWVVWYSFFLSLDM